ncbi:MAG: c-type cytochrome [Acidimicrobiales bacterium]
MGRRRAARCAFASLLLLASCATERSTPTATALAPSDGTIVRVGSALWVASPDDRSVDVVDASTMRTTSRTETDGTPARLLAVGRRVLASFADRPSLAVLSGGSSPSPIAVPCAATSGLATWTSGGRTFGAAACPVDARVAIVDLDRDSAIGWLSAPNRTTAVTVDGRDLVAAGAMGELRRWPLGAVADAGVADGSGPGELAVRGRRGDVWVLRGRRSSQLRTIVPSPAGAVAAYQVVDSERAADPTDPADTGSYAAVIKGNARVEPAVSGWCPHQYSDVADASHALAGPSALAVDAARRRLWVVGEYTGNVLVLDCAAPARLVDGVRRAVVLASFDVGVGARGIVLSADGDTAWVDSAFDHSVVRLRMSNRPEPVARELGTLTLSPDAEQGRRSFHDATDVHLTPNRVVSCASCHTDGGDDGLSWRISTKDIARKYRRSMPLWALVPERDTGGVLHWDAGFTSLDTLTTETIHQLLGGDALMVDRSAIAQWLSELSAPPAAEAAASAPAEVEAGRVLFEGAAGCATCHTGASGSDGKLHDVTSRSTDPDGVMARVRTPRLVGLAGRSPYLHDGRALTIEDVLTDNPGDRHGVTSTLTDEQRAALVAYLESR